MSNTSPKLTIRFEAETKERLKAMQDEFLEVVNKYINEYNL